MISADHIFQELERSAIEWGRSKMIAKVGDRVNAYLGEKKKVKSTLEVSHVYVTFGRNAQKTIHKTLVLIYIGRRLKRNKEFLDKPGSGRVLKEFTTESGHIYNIEQFGANDISSDAGLSFTVDFDPICRELYPNAYSSYASPFFNYSYPP